MRYRFSSPHRQRGAALAIGLILLLVITVLAVSGMNTASMELLMAGNEQYRQRAFHAASTGIEQALGALPTVPQTADGQDAEGEIRMGAGEDEEEEEDSEPIAAFTTNSRYIGDDLNVPGFSTGKFVGLHYVITSEGTSSRNARSQQTQGAFVIQNAGGTSTFGSIQ